MLVRVLACILATTLLSSAAWAEVPHSNALRPSVALVEGNTEFAVELYKRVARHHTNAVVSPLSVSTASGMLYAGARGSTSEEIADALNFRLPEVELHPAFGSLLDELKTRVEPWASLVIANGLWVDDECSLLPTYSDVLTHNYGATAKPVDFGGAPVEAAQSINEWVSDETQGKITSLVSPSMFRDLTRVTLVSTVYFLAAWQHGFDANETRDEFFQLVDGSTVPVPMMHRSSVLPYYEDDSVQVLELPYQGSGLSMLVLLPGAHVGLEALEEGLSPESLSEWFGALDRRGVNAAIPRFHSSSRIDLIPILTDLGMNRAFRFGEADLTGICADPQLFVERADHLVTLGLTERGTEAAAATVYVITASSVAEPDEETEFRADRPFMYVVRDMKRGTILFMGRVTDPKRQ